MKAIKINGNIKVYSNLPNSWEGVMGNFSKLSDEEIKAYGFYDIVTPDYNPTIQKLSDSITVYQKYENNLIISVLRSIILSLNFLKKRVNDFTNN